MASSAAMTSQARLDRLHALRRSLYRAQAIGPFSIPLAAGLGLGFLASFAVDAALYRSVDIPLRQVIDAAVFAAVAAPVWLLVQRGAVRDAHEVMSWLNGWETERWQIEIGRRLSTLPRANPGVLDALPDTMGLRPLRVELLAVRGQHGVEPSNRARARLQKTPDERERLLALVFERLGCKGLVAAGLLRRDPGAYDRLEHLPTDTPWQRFERAALEEGLAFLGDGPALIGPMEAWAAQIDDDERRLVARGMVAAARARRAAVDGSDAIGPLAALREELDDRPRRYAYPYWTGVVLMVGAIAVLASAAVAITAAIIR